MIEALSLEPAKNCLSGIFPLDYEDDIALMRAVRDLLFSEQYEAGNPEYIKPRGEGVVERINFLFRGFDGDTLRAFNFTLSHRRPHVGSYDSGTHNLAARSMGFTVHHYLTEWLDWF